MTKTMNTFVSAVLLALALPLFAGAENGRWRGPDGAFLPFMTDAGILDFLREAEVVERQRLSRGINRHLRVLLSRDGVEARAVFRANNTWKPRHTTGGKVFIDFHDSYVYECAAYELSRLLGLDNVPPCVIRELGKRRGTIQLWIENTMTESERRHAGHVAPSGIWWVRQKQTRLLFDALIYNFDRNQGNILIDDDWKLWLIDHGRSFHKSDRIDELERIFWCERGLWEGLRALDRESLDRHLKGLIEDDRIRFVLLRRNVLVKHLEERMAQLGEAVVLYGPPGKDGDPH